MRLIAIAFLLIATAIQGQAQEFLATVRVTAAPTLQTTDPKILEAMEKQVQEFFNTQQFTDDEYLPEEKIKCNIQVTITQESGNGGFSADIGIQAVRPVYGSTYESPLLTHLDKEVIIDFEEFRPLQMVKDNYVDNLSSFLSFYAFIILGLDHDSYIPFGGDDYYNIALSIINALPPQIVDRDKGWASAREKRLRFNIVNGILDPRAKQYRQALYDYHRKGLDIMHKDVVEGKNAITSAIERINDVEKNNPNVFIVQIFTNTKAAEIANIFREGELEQRNKVHRLMTRMDPANSIKYEPIKRG